MLKMNLQFFSHHKGGGSTSNGRNSAGRRLGSKRADGQFVKAVPRSILVKTLVAAAMIPYLQPLMALLSSNASAVIRRRFQFIRQQLLNKD